MSQPNDIKLGPPCDVQLLNPRGRRYSENWDLIYREDRAASALLRRDVRARKLNLVISYTTADQDTVDRCDYLMGVDGPLVLKVTHLTTTKTYSVLMSPFNKRRLLAVAGGLWQGLEIRLSEV